MTNVAVAYTAASTLRLTTNNPNCAQFLRMARTTRAIARMTNTVTVSAT